MSADDGKKEDKLANELKKAVKKVEPKGDGLKKIIKKTEKKTGRGKDRSN